MPRLKRLSGREVASILEGFGFAVVLQRGSHVKLRRVVQGQAQTLHVPLHSQLDTGTCQAIFRETTRYIPEDEVRPHFYSD